MKSIYLLLLSIGFETLVLAQTQPAYQTETWEPVRTLVWAHPGQDGVLSDPANWRLADGTLASTPPDRTTDVILPAASKPYRVSGERTDQVRHVTVENNGIFTGAHRNEIEIWGNCHVKAGGFAKYISVRGSKHTFFKIDDSEFPTPENGKVFHHPGRRVSFEQLCRSHISHKFQVCKYGSASVEFLGKMGVSDEIMVQHGKMIVSDEFRFSGVTGKGALEIYDGGILELQSGARVAPFVPDNRKCVYNVNVYRNGVLQAGSPERPLTCDAFFMLGFTENDQPGRSGLYAALGSMIRVYSTDPTKARLVITAMTSDPDFHDGQGKRIGNPTEKAQGNKGIVMQLAGDIQLNGVNFDYVCDGGIGLTGAALPPTWSHVTWGTHNAGAPATLFSKLAVNPNVYYHPRSDQKSEYGLTVRAVAQMQEYLEEADPFYIQTLPPSIISSITGDSPSVAGDSKPVLQVTAGTETQTNTVFLFDPEDDAYLENGRPINSGQLRIEAGKRIIYLKFNVSGLSGNVQYATLKLTENGDTGNGNLRVYRGSHNNWTEDNITISNAPDKDGEIGSYSGSVGAWQMIEIDVSSLITGNGVYSLVIEMDDGGNDIWFGSKENGNRDYKTPVAVVFHEPVIFHKPIDVTIQTRVPGAKIRYTLDGTEPTKNSLVYEGPIHLDKTTKVTAKAYKPGVGFSSVFSTTYVFE